MTHPGVLSRYIGMRFAIAMLAAFTLCLVLIFLIDFVEVLREQSAGPGGIGGVLALTALRLPAFAEMTIPFAVLIGALGALLMLSRASELVVLRAAGLSAWRFILPGVAVAALAGVLSITAYNPLGAAARAIAERREASAAGESPAAAARAGGTWLRQDGPDGGSVMRARAVADRGTTLGGVSLLQFDRSGGFVARVEAAQAQLEPGQWVLTDAKVTRPGEATSLTSRYIAKTFLDASQVTANIAAVESVSFWALPAFIDYAERAGLQVSRYKLHYQTMLARPLLYAVMVLVAATAALKSFRFGKIQTMVLKGLGGGFAVFVLAEISRKLGQAEWVSAVVAAWGPIAITGLVAATVLLHQEDG